MTEFHFIRCDKCKTKVRTDGKITFKLSNVRGYCMLMNNVIAPPNWIRTEDKDLCPMCAKRYNIHKDNFFEE